MLEDSDVKAEDLTYELVNSDILHTWEVYRFGSPEDANLIAQKAREKYEERRGRLGKLLDNLTDYNYEVRDNFVEISYGVPYLLNPAKDLAL